MPDPIALPGNRSVFDRFAKLAAKVTGRPIAFIAAVTTLVVWAATRPLFDSFDSWQMVINTGTTIVTFLMVFLIQNSQNRDSAAVQLKLDELIRAVHGAHNAMLDLEELSERELEAIRDKYEALAKAAREQLRRGERDDDSPDLDALPKG